MKHRQKSISRPKRRGKFYLALMLLGVLLLGLIFAGPGLPQPVTAQGDNPSPPGQVVKLVFVHHSTGENWLDDGQGGLGIALGNNNYFVSDTNYGWGPNGIGDRTDILNWPEWFNGPDSGMYMDALYNLSDQNSWYTRQLSDPGGENQIVMFKSCFPNSALEGSPGDPPSNDDYLTVGRAKQIYIDMLSYFATRQDKLFIAIAAPPLLDPTYSANARAFNNWLVYDWLRDYPHSNVAVFDFYNILTGPDNHHRFQNGAIEHVTVGGDTLHYPTNGDEHPSPAGSQKATNEFVPLLNIYYHRWQGEGPPAQPAPVVEETTAEEAEAEEEEAEETEAEEEGAEETEAEEEEAEEMEAEQEEAEAGPSVLAAGAVVDDFEGAYEADQLWEMWIDDQADTSLAFALDTEVAHEGSSSLRMELDIAPGSWGDFGRPFDSAQDWSDGEGLSLWLRPGEEAEVEGVSVGLHSGESGNSTPFDVWFEILPEQADSSGWILAELAWDSFVKPDWAGTDGLSELDPSRVVGFSLSFSAPDDSWAEGVVWVDDISLLSEAPQVAPTEAEPAPEPTEEPPEEPQPAPTEAEPEPEPTEIPTTAPTAEPTATEAAVAAAPTSPPAPAEPAAEEGESKGFCPLGMVLALAGLVLAKRGIVRSKVSSQ